jgi:hypothetical protein
MFCPKCGENLPDGSKFCGACGANLAELIGDSPAAPVGGEGAAQPQGTAQPVSAQPKAKKKLGLIIGLCAAALVVILVAVVAVKVLLFSGSGSDAYAYMASGKYQYVTDLTRDQTVELSSSKVSGAYNAMLTFSPDGKYLYYYSKYDSSTATGSLYRVEYAKLKANSSKNDRYMELIATNVRLGCSPLEDGGVLYQNGDDTLYYFDGKEPFQIAKSVNSYFMDGSSRIIYETWDSEKGSTLYAVALKDIDNKVKLAANYESLYYVEDMNNIFYTRLNDDGVRDRYVVGVEKDSEKLGENVNLYLAADGCAYFTAASGETLSLYDYVEDPDQAADAGIKEPVLDDYSVPTYGYYTLNSESDPNEYGEIYTSCTKPAAFYRSWFSYRSLEYAAGETGDHQADYQAFVDKYKEQEDENGYIVVTDQVKSDLIALAQTCGQGYEGEWMELCFYKEQNGTSYDYDTYHADYDTYNEAKDRITMREALQSLDNAWPIQDLYCYRDGALTLISENVLDAVGMGGALMYSTRELVADKLPLTEVTSVAQVQALLSLDYGRPNYLLSPGETTPVQMSAMAAEAFAESYEEDLSSLYLVGSDLYLNTYSGELSTAQVSQGTVGSFHLITDDASVIGAIGSTLYYTSGSYYSTTGIYQDLYSYTSGKSTRLAQDVGYYEQYEDGVILAYTAYRSGYGAELTLISSNGDKTILDDDVTQFIRVNKSTLLYLADDDLYLYNGKRKTMLHSNVDMIWSRNQMDTVQPYGVDGLCFWSY